MQYLTPIWSLISTGFGGEDRRGRAGRDEIDARVTSISVNTIGIGATPRMHNARPNPRI